MLPVKQTNAAVAEFPLEVHPVRLDLLDNPETMAPPDSQAGLAMMRRPHNVTMLPPLDAKHAQPHRMVNLVHPAHRDHQERLVIQERQLMVEAKDQKDHRDRQGLLDNLVIKDHLDSQERQDNFAKDHRKLDRLAHRELQEHQEIRERLDSRDNQVILADRDRPAIQEDRASLDTPEVLERLVKLAVKAAMVNATIVLHRERHLAIDERIMNMEKGEFMKMSKRMNEDGQMFRMDLIVIITTTTTTVLITFIKK